MSSKADSAQANHLCVLVHGLWGNPSHLGYLASTLQEAYPKDKLRVLVAKSNANSFTYDGIELGGERITHEIEREVEELEKSGCKITKLSMVGYSLGGLIARYAVGLLYSSGFFDKIQPMNFTTFASPHLGVRTPILGPHSYVWNVLGARILSTSGRQLFTVDSFRDTGRPLLCVLADPTSIFIRGLSLFKHKTLYANTINDRSAVYYTTCISAKDPFVNLDAIETQPLPDTDGVILSPEEPVRHKSRVPMGLVERLITSGRQTITNIPFYLLLVVFVPIGSTFLIVNSGYQTIRSAQRVKLHESGKAGIGVERYRIPLLEEARSFGDRVYERLNADQGEDYLPTPPPEEETATSETKSQNQVTEQRRRAGTVTGLDKFATLALTSEQFEMIDGLDSVGWLKYPVHITKVRHTHAAIVVRSQWRKGFDQGKIVVGHWVKNFEL